jgi:hypothetical protein
MNIEQRMMNIFSGRTDSYGQDVDKDGVKGKGGMRVDRPVTEALFKKHLDGNMGLGIYPTWHRDDGTLMASWGCCDIDTGDWSEAYGLATALKAMGIVPHIERSRSKGWHVWVFPTDPVPAATMRRALKVAYAAIELPAKEANPKQEKLRHGQVGNYVRLPYKGGWYQNERQMFMQGWDSDGEGVVVPPSDWLYEFDGSFQTESGSLVDWASRWREPERKHLGSVEVMDDAKLRKLVGNLPGDLMLFVQKGPQHDRSGGLVALAHKMRSQGYDAAEIYNVVSVAHDSWGGKYNNHHNPEAYLLDIVERCL